MTRRAPLALALLLSALLTACAGTAATGAAPADDPPTAAEPETAAGAPSDTESASPADAPEDLAVTDAEGTEVAPDAPVERVVCLRSECLDMLRSLDMVPVGGPESYDELAHEGWFYGADADDIGLVGGTVSEPNLEDIAALEPDLIIGYVGSHGGPAGGIRESLRAIAPLYLYEDATMDEVFENLRELGTLTDRTDEAETAIAAFEEKVADYAERSPQDRTALMIVGTDTNFTTYLETSLQGALFAEVTPYPWPVTDLVEDGESTVKYSIEEVLKTDPDVIFLQDFAESSSPLPEQLAQNPLWGELTAVQNGELHSVPASEWHTSKQLVMMSRMLDEAMPLLYPDVFDAPPT